MTPVKAHPTYATTEVCEALTCTRRAYRIDDCREEGCGHRWQREAAEDRARREVKDAKGREDTR